MDRLDLFWRPAKVRSRAGFIAFLLVLAAGCNSTFDKPAPVDPRSPEFQEVVADVWQTLLERNIRLQFSEGIFPRSIPELSVAANEAALARNESLLQALSQAPESVLSRQQSLTREILIWFLTADSELRRFYWLEPVLTPYKAWDYGPIEDIAIAYPLTTASERDDYLAYLRAYAGHLQQRLEKTRGQASRAIRIPRPALASIVDSYTSMADSGLDAFRVADHRVAELPPGEYTAFLGDVDDVIENEIRPAILAISDYLQSDDYRLLAPESVGFAQYPQGKAYYRALVRFHTTLNLEPEEIFEYGQQRMAELQAAMQRIRNDLGFAGTAQAFLDSLRNDPSMRAVDAEQLESHYLTAVEAIRPHLGDYFERLPDAPFEVRRMDPAREATLTFGLYDSPTPAEPAGVYWFNARDLDAKLTLEVAPLIYHELMPGHHMQVALALENDELPVVRRKAFYFTAYSEGWADYASTLAIDMGLAEDPTKRYGFLTNEAFTVARLVLDVGLNYYGWSMEQATDYFLQATYVSENDSRTEILRYSTDIPAQALGYRIGQRWFEDARKRARNQMGTGFDVRSFHTLMLEDGEMPLAVLEQVLNEYLVQPQN